MVSGLSLILWYFLQEKQYQQIKKEHLLFDDKIFASFKEQRGKRKNKYAIVLIIGVVILFASSEIEYILQVVVGCAVCNIIEWIMDALWSALIIWAGLSMHTDSVIIKNAKQPPKNKPYI